uniref:Transmembrane protein n=1 Tax=Phaeomonas parva TaxID=124430 RepID=A0A6U4EE63_9STRA|mmetsp:Transcript_20443/g.62230  ORF Transcript_20443/g.62230 Transcript_20443/m.62230 type:complete len:149 (+) Transcript_20443:127-573(+)|eukprot:CAMPEP_0118881504 /NCGR_PEP_ID=MMETSP1163-20130328/20970_1 /TAXON_ID=124430 /ORGANISM="Phaeomonas parva, Strain CCMP2877" /LENGTH=148 /DNA_ID=CAMNT_0006818305 /DNA_START=358 /DNA_END=804 /DNA_ORIENTATION=-
MEANSKSSGYYRRSLSSLPLQILVYFNGWFSTMFFLLGIALFLYKRYNLYYAGNGFGWDLAMLFLMTVLDALRLFLGSKGNKTEHAGALMWFIFLTVPICVGYAYLLTLQTYVLRIDVVLCSLGLIFVGFECLISIFTCVQFLRAYRG